MFKLYLLSEFITNGYIVEVLGFISLVSILFGILVITSKNPIVSVLFLIGLFLSISCYLIMLGLNFIGLSYLLVYVGAVSILFLFILMLINVRISELLSDTSNSVPLAIIASISFYTYIIRILPEDSFVYISNYMRDTFFLALWSPRTSWGSQVGSQAKIFSLYKNSEIALVSTNNWEGSLAETSHITSIGNIMYTSYSIWLIITSIILLLAMIGVITIVIKNSKDKVSPTYKSK